MVGSRILIALNELEVWSHRHAKLKNEYKILPFKERLTKKRELSRVSEQIAYYRALVRDMKRRINPPRLHQLFGLLIILHIRSAHRGHPTGDYCSKTTVIR